MRAFRIAYDGRPYYGFQRQPTVPTVEGALFDALRELSILPAEVDKPAGYAAAGRTDAGVSAVAQTVAFECPDWLRPRALNSELPPTIRAWASADVSEEFHATHDASRRCYRYHYLAPQDEQSAMAGQSAADAAATSEDSGIDDDRAAAAAERLSGDHELQNLTPDEEGTQRSLSVSVARDGDILEIHVEAGGFPRQLVRRLVSVITAVGSGQQSIAWIDELLGAAPIEPRPPSAPPEPLVLWDVAYPGCAFERDQAAAASGATAFGARARDARISHRVRKAVADRLLDSKL